MINSTFYIKNRTNTLGNTQENKVAVWPHHQFYCASHNFSYLSGLNFFQTTSLDVVINCLVGIESAEHRMQELVAHLNSFLVGEHPSSLKELCLKLLLIICTGGTCNSKHFFTSI